MAKSVQKKTSRAAAAKRTAKKKSAGKRSAAHAKKAPRAASSKSGRGKAAASKASKGSKKLSKKKAPARKPAGKSVTAATKAAATTRKSPTRKLAAKPKAKPTPKPKATAPKPKPKAKPAKTPATVTAAKAPGKPTAAVTKPAPTPGKPGSDAKARFNGSVKSPTVNGSANHMPPRVNRPAPSGRARLTPPKVPYASLASAPAAPSSTYDPHNHTPPTDAQLRKVKTGLTGRDLTHFRELLLFRRAEIMGDVAGLSASRSGSAGEISHMPLHMADVGSDNYEQEFTLGLMEYERRNLLEIDDALRRVANKTYGVCVESGVPIGRARLEAKPWAKHCIEVARERERRGM